MYRVIVDGEPDRFSETLVYIKLAGNGCYVPCEQDAAAGFCVKLPYEYTDEDGELIKTVIDTVFALFEGALTGKEIVASVEEVVEASEGEE